jgi:hypothetical protein
MGDAGCSHATMKNARKNNQVKVLISLQDIHVVRNISVSWTISFFPEN